MKKILILLLVVYSYSTDAFAKDKGEKFKTNVSMSIEEIMIGLSPIISSDDIHLQDTALFFVSVARFEEKIIIFLVKDDENESRGYMITVLNMQLIQTDFELFSIVLKEQIGFKKTELMRKEEEKKITYLKDSYGLMKKKLSV